MSKEFNIRNYQINFHRIFKIPEIHQAFYKYCKTEYNEDPVDFIKEAEEFKETGGEDKNLLERFEGLYRKYIENNAVHQINISGKLQRRMEDLIKKKCEDREELEKCLDELLQVVYLELKVDTFPRFMRSKICFNAVRKYQNDKELLQPKLVINYPYNEADLYRDELLDKDFAFIKAVLEDGFDWELVYSDYKLQTNSYMSKVNYLPDLELFKKATPFKAEVILPFSFEQTVLSFIPTFEFSDLDPFVVRMDNLHNELNKAIPYSIFLMDLQFPFPFNKRRFLFTSGLKYYKDEQTLILILKPCDTKRIANYEYLKKCKEETDKKAAIAVATFAGFKFQKIDDNTTKVCELHINDAGAWMSNFPFRKSVVRDRGKKWARNIIQWFSKKTKVELQKEKLEKDAWGMLMLKNEDLMETLSNAF